ncbi:nuclear transport factor 2 family protein [Ferrimonas pelagia]|uniref:DUF4440 domain-containing protein n=1 Tax=Ferrimonas pelagia TaxID=1177826 RepID=A0ABP9F9Z1_9GAMM
MPHPVLAQIEHINQAIREGDKVLYASVYSEDVLFTFSENGKLYPRDQLLKNVKPAPNFRPMNDEFLVHDYGHTVVVNFRSRIHEELDARRVTMTFIEQNGGWRAVAAHSTSITE